MSETSLMTIEKAVQVGDDLLIFPTLPTILHLAGLSTVKIVKPDNQVIEKEVDFGRAFDAPDVYLLMILNTQTDEIPVGSQIWIQKLLE
jgi:hypothetical protein